MEISVILPSYNPTEKLLLTVNELSKTGFDDIIVINDGSDKTEIFDKAAENSFVTVISHDINRGKGRALKTGFEYFIKNRPNKIGLVTADDDMQHTASDIAACCAEMEKTGLAVFGARSFKGGEIPPKSRIGNNITSFTLRFLCGIGITDTQTGLRAIPRSYLPCLVKTEGERFEYETNMLLSMKENGLLFKEVSIKTIYADNNAGTHFRPIRDSVKIYAVILKYIASSLAASAIDLLGFTLLNLLLPKSWDDSLRILVSTAAARAVSSAVNFTVNRRRVFKSKGRIDKALLKYYALAVCQAIASYGLVYLAALASGTGRSILQTVYKIIVDTLLFFACFVLQREWVFKDGGVKK